MPISVICHGCSQRLKAPDQFAGKQLKCLKCGRLLAIPRPAPPASEPGKAPAPSRAAKRPAQSQPDVEELAAAFLSEGDDTSAAPWNRQQATKRTPDVGHMFTPPLPSLPPASKPVHLPPLTECPSCAETLPPSAVLCVSCGFDVRTGQKLRPAKAKGSHWILWVAAGAALVISGGSFFAYHSHKTNQGKHEQELAAQERARHEQLTRDEEARTQAAQLEQARQELARQRQALAQEARSRVAAEQRLTQMQSEQQSIAAQQAAQAEEWRAQEEAARKQAAAPYVDGTDDFARITQLPERFVGKNYYFSGTYLPAYLSRDKAHVLFTIGFGNNTGTVSRRLSRDALSLIVTEAMADQLLKLRQAKSGYYTVLYAQIMYLDAINKQYPVAYITKIDFTELDQRVWKEYIAITLTADGKGVVHPNPYER